MYEILSKEELVVFNDELWMDKTSKNSNVYQSGLELNFSIASNLQIQAKSNDQIIGILSEGVSFMVLRNFLLDPTIRLTAKVADHTTFQLEHDSDFRINVVAFERIPLQRLPDGSSFLLCERISFYIDSQFSNDAKSGERVLVIPENDHLCILNSSGKWLSETNNVFNDRFPEKSQEYIRYYGYLIFKDNEIIYGPMVTESEFGAVESYLLIYVYENEHPINHPNVSSLKPPKIPKNKIPSHTHTLDFEDYQTQRISANFDTLYPELKAITLGGILPWKEVMRFKSDALYMDATGRVLRVDRRPFSVSYWFRLYSTTRLVEKGGNILAILQTPIKQSDGSFSSLCKGSDKDGYLIWQVPNDVMDPIDWINDNKENGVFVSEEKLEKKISYEDIETMSDNSTLYSINDARSRKSYAGIGKCEYFEPFSPGTDDFEGLCYATGDRKKVDSEYGFSICMNKQSSGLCIYKKEAAYRPNNTANSYSDREKSGGCYIATAVYGDYSAPEVVSFRKYRDKVLLNRFVGRLFVRTYYAIGPLLVKIFDKNEFIKQQMKKFLDWLLPKVKRKLNSNL